ncbi:uncharacterized protein LOC118217354 [Anguilla anguilla]|uniref:uncharacterized protein LOC118217354 n=1 Tax=Anguilla anguilla TaxID=7936 RepID=UPI0015AA2612|nr:uncharacterized protein LOC118217354 [Anguilla anguilla]
MPFIILVFLLELVSLSYAHLNISNLNCFNDYECTMVCEFTSEMLLNCSAYSVDFVSEDQEHFMCAFVNSSRDSLYRCGCTVEMPLMVNEQKYTRNLLEGRRVINTMTITALDNIKPRAPEILSVARTENGNYNILCDLRYNESSFLYARLEIQLSYRKKGEADASWRTINATLPSQEIPGGDLEPNSKYIVKARSHSPDYNTQFSDWSRELEWTVPASVQSVWKTIIPVLSVLLVIIICASYQCWTRLKTQWWDRIPSPENDIKYMLPGNPKVFAPKLYDPWSIQPDALTVANAEEKSRDPPESSECDQDDLYKNVGILQPAADSANSRAGPGGSADSRGSSQHGYRNVLCLRSPGTPPPEPAGCETPSPAALPGPDADPCLVCSDPGLLVTPDLLTHLQRKLHAPDSLTEAPSVSTDFEYRSCNGGNTNAPPAEGADLSSSFKGDTLETLLQNTCALTCVLPCRADDGYESFGEAVARSSQVQANFPACTLGPCEEGYQMLRTVDEHIEHQFLAPGKTDLEASSVEGPESCTGQDQNLPQIPKGGIPHSVIPCHFLSQCTPKSSMESSPHSALNTPPVIQTIIESSYQRV